MNYGEVDIRDPRTQIPNTARVLFADWMRDPHICAAPDGCYYLTGTTRKPGSPDGKAGMWSDGIRVWRSPDLQTWGPLGLVWSPDRDGTWPRFFHIHEAGQVRVVEPAAFRAAVPGPDVVVRRSLWAPEIHWVRSLQTFVLVVSMNYGMGVCVQSARQTRRPLLSVAGMPARHRPDAVGRRSNHSRCLSGRQRCAVQMVKEPVGHAGAHWVPVGQPATVGRGVPAEVGRAV